MHSPSKRKRESDDDENPCKRSTVDNNPGDGTNEQQHNRNVVTEAENKNAEEDVWEDDDFDAILTQPENLSRLDSLIASSQMIEQDKKESTHRLTLPPIYIETDLGKEMFRDLNQQVDTLKQQLFAKAGQVKFLNENFTKLQRTLYEERATSSNFLEELKIKFDREREHMKNEISSLKAQIEFKQHDVNKSNFAQTGPRPQTSQFSCRTKSVEELAPSMLRKRNPETNGFQNRSAFTGVRKVEAKDGFCQTGSQDDRFHIKDWKLRGKASSKFKLAYVRGVLGMQSSLRHYANRLEFGEVRCQQNHQVCQVKDQLKSSKFVKNPSSDRVLVMYHELVSKKALCSGAELLHGTDLAFPSLDRTPVDSTVMAFLEETSKDLKSYLEALDGKKTQTLPVVVDPPRRKKRHRKASNAAPKGVNPMADVLSMVHGVLTLCSQNEHKHTFKTALFKELMITLVDIANKESLENEYEMVMMCLKIIISSLKCTEPETTSCFDLLLDGHGLIPTVLSGEDSLEKPSEAHKLLSLLVLEVVTSLTLSSRLKSKTCKEINGECILSLACSFVSRIRSNVNLSFPSLQRQFYSLVGSLLPLRLNGNSNEEPISPCNCIDKAFKEILLGLDELSEMSTKSCPPDQLNIVRGGMAVLTFFVEKFPWTVRARKGLYLCVSSCLQRVFKRYEDSLTTGIDYEELLTLFKFLSPEPKSEAALENVDANNPTE